MIRSPGLRTGVGWAARAYVKGFQLAGAPQVCAAAECSSSTLRASRARWGRVTFPILGGRGGPLKRGRVVAAPGA
ncbi:hypothetical protein DEGR_23940 [Deinococcus grandis]|nr:hypothetical protein DEGR_23940 [Deinococcus grandis]